jgi:hypothetical protein
VASLSFVEPEPAAEPDVEEDADAEQESMSIDMESVEGIETDAAELDVTEEAEESEKAAIVIDPEQLNLF